MFVPMSRLVPRRTSRSPATTLERSTWNGNPSHLPARPSAHPLRREREALALTVSPQKNGRFLSQILTTPSANVILGSGVDRSAGRARRGAPDAGAPGAAPAAALGVVRFW